MFGLPEGRSSTQWVDFDFFGHQLVIHEHPKIGVPGARAYQSRRRSRRARAALRCRARLGQWEALAERLQSFGIQFVIEPHIRFRGQTGEQATMFLLDPCGNALEFKAFKDIGQLFAK